ncbi:DUF1080 domain-containing protein [Thermostilla marina]
MIDRFFRCAAYLVLAAGIVCGWSIGVRGDEPLPEGFVSMFNGRDLTGWEGKPGWWHVEDGAITCESTPEHPCTKHNYLIWRGGTPGDFELRLKYRIQGGNSGVQFRSREIPDFDTRGYQADIDAAGKWTGALFEHARGGVALRGQRVVIDPDGTRHETQFADPAELLKYVHTDGWNEYRIVAKGNHIVLSINGHVTAEVYDDQEGQAARKGIIALQMHPGPPMKVQFKDLMIRIDDPKEAASGSDRR